MKRNLKIFLVLLLLSCLVIFPSSQAFGREISYNIDLRKIQDHVRFFSSLGSRVTGYPGADEAARYIRDTFRRYGLRDVMVQEFEVLVPVSHGAKMVLADTGEDIEIYPLWPNNVRLSSLSSEGLVGDLVYVGHGELEELDGLPIEGNIALIEFNSGTNWVELANLGATAIIFIEPKDATRDEAEEKFLSTPAHIPRFWLPRDKAELIMRTHMGISIMEDGIRSSVTDSTRLSFLTGETKNVSITLYSHVRWEKRLGKNVMGYVGGTDPELSNELIILHANYDSMSVVPDLAPGGEQAVSIATLLEMAYAYELHPPKRSVLFLATSGHGQSMAGLRAFVDHQLSIEEGVKYAERPIDYLSRELSETFFISLDLTSTNRLSTFFYSGYMYGMNVTGTASRFGKMHTLFNKLASQTASDIRVLERDYYIDSISEMLAKEEGPDGTGMEAEMEPADEKKAWEINMGQQLPLASEVFLLGGGPGLTFITAQDPRVYIDTPHDLGSKVDVRNVQLQARYISSLIWRFVNLTKEEGYPEPLKLSKSFRRLTGEVTRLNPEPGLEKTIPVESAIVAARQGFKTRVGVRGDALTLTRDDGSFYVPGVPSANVIRSARLTIEGYLLNEDSGQISHATNLSSEGAVDQQLLSFPVDRGPRSLQLTLFPARSTLLFDVIDENLSRYGNALSVKVYAGHGVYTFSEYGYSIPKDPIRERAFTIFLPVDTEVKFAFGPPSGKPSVVLTNASQQTPNGKGFETKADGIIHMTGLQALNDMWWLNESRITTMKANGVEQNHRVRQLHSGAKAYMDRAVALLHEGKYSDFTDTLNSAKGMVLEVYPVLRDTVTDIVKGFLFYIALLFPFTFLTERLIFCFNEFNKRTLGVISIFMVVVLALKFVHPAFKLTHNPWILVFGFLLMMLFILTTITLINGFSKAVSRKRRRPGTLRTVDINRSAAFAMAFSLGVVNMRKRKLRTGLTCLTLILLMFLLMSFTSVLPYMSYTKIYLSDTDAQEGAFFRSASYDGFLIKDEEYAPIPEAIYDLLERSMHGEHFISARSWYTPARRIDVTSGGETYQIKGVMGLQPGEIRISPVKETLVAGRWFQEDDIDERPEQVRGAKHLRDLQLQEEFIRGKVAVISSDLAETFGIGEDDVGRATVSMNIPLEERDEFGKLKIRSFEFLVIGIFDSWEYGKIRDIDSSLLTPMDFQRVTGQGGPQEPAETIIIPFEAALDMGGDITMLAIRPSEGIDYMDFLNDVIATVSYPVYVAKDGNVELYKPSGLSGLTRHVELAIPVLLVCLIVLNVMLGAVYERSKEIEIYTALGLSPAHVGGLFLAESCTYAILGGLPGYVIGQLLAKFVVRFDFFKGLSLNYSSMAAIGPLALLMGVVVVSSIYPVRLAATRSAPTIERKWKRPSFGTGEALFELPFVLVRSEAVAICGFLKEFFEVHEGSDSSDFSTRDIQIVKEAVEHGTMFVVKCVAHVAPYDLGINQAVEVRLVPEVGGTRHLVHLYLNRLTGDVPSWQRTNHTFMDTIRKQFLAWRAVSISDKEEFEAIGKKLLGEEEVEHEVIQGEPVVASEKSVIIRLLDDVVIRIRKEHEDIIGIDQVSYGELPLRNPSIPIRPIFESSDGIRYTGWRYVSFERHGEAVLVHTKLVGRKLPYASRLDPLQRPILTQPEPVTEEEAFIDDLDLLIIPYQIQLGDETYTGFGYQYNFRSSDPDRKVDAFYETSTWELGGLAEGKTLILPGYDNPPEFVVTPDATFTTESQKLVGILGRMLPRFALLECFDFQYSEAGSMVIYYDEPQLIWSCVRKTKDSHVIEFYDKIQFSSGSDVKTPMKYILTSKERCHRATGRNRWTQMRDLIYSRYHEKLGLKGQEPRVTIRRELLTHGVHFEQMAKETTALAEWGFHRIDMGPIWKSDFTEGCGLIREKGGSGSPYAIWDLEVAEALGGIEALKNLCTEADKGGIEVMAWILPALSELSPLFKDNRDWAISHIDGWPYKANYIDVIGANMNSGFANHLSSKLSKISKETGLGSIFLGRFPIFGVVPVHYGERGLVPQLKGVLKTLTDLQKGGNVSADGRSPFALPSLDGEVLGYLKGIEFIGYNTSIEIDAQAFKEGKLDLFQYYRLLANKAVPTIVWRGDEHFQDILPQEIMELNRIFKKAQPMMKKRRLLAEDRGVEWQDPDSENRIIFAFKSFDYQVDITREVMELTTGEMVEVDEYGRFQVEPGRIYQTVELFGGKGSNVKVLIAQEGVESIKDVENVAVRVVETLEDGSVAAVVIYSQMGHLVHWLFKHGSVVEILEPKDMREELRSFGETMLSIYQRKKAVGN